MYKIILFVLILITNYCYAQDNSFIYLSIGGNDMAIVSKIAKEQEGKPLLIYNDKIYAVGGDCVIEAFRLNGGDANDRNKGGDLSSRNKGGDLSDRNKGGDLSARNKGGDMDSRNKGGDLSARNKGGDLNDRNRSSDITGSRCEIAANGKVLIYTFYKISSKKSKIYYNGNYYNKKFFKIIKI